MPSYLLSIWQPDGPGPAPEVLDRVMRDVEALVEELRGQGALVFTAGLEPPARASVLRPQGGGVGAKDGPFTGGREHVGGVVILRAPDRAAALEWGGRLSRATTLPVEVRAFQAAEGEG